MKTITGKIHVAGFPFLPLATRKRMSTELAIGDTIRLLDSALA